MEFHTAKLAREFSDSTRPFEEFATRVAEAALFDMGRSRWTGFAEAIFAADWTRYANERCGKRFAMSDVLADGRKTELDHIRFVRTLPDPLSFPAHDHSKDSFYVLMCVLRFRYPAFDATEYAWFCKFLDKIVFREHYVAERHHPEHEMYVDGGECDTRDVTETAVDRMARNFQFSDDGMGDVERMREFKPKWTRNNERNVEHYDRVVETYYDLIGRLWRSFR